MPQKSAGKLMMAGRFEHFFHQRSECGATKSGQPVLKSRMEFNENKISQVEPGLKSYELKNERIS